jgi:hypothetical protein
MKSREGVEEYFELRQGELWFVPSWGRSCIFRMPVGDELPEARPRHCHGSGVTDFIGRMAYWILTGKPTAIVTRHWGYKTTALAAIHEKARAIGMIGAAV